MKNLTDKLARHLGDLRKSKNLTLDQLAKSSGVSRAALSRLENGEVSPTADVLDKLGTAYGMGLVQILAGLEDGFTQHISKDDQSVLRDAEAGVIRREVSPGAKGLAADMQEIKLQPDSRWDIVAKDALGQEHHIVMLNGYMKVALGEGEQALGPGDAFRYRLDGDVVHLTDKGQGAKYMLCRVAP